MSSRKNQQLLSPLYSALRKRSEPFPNASKGFICFCWHQSTSFQQHVTFLTIKIQHMIYPPWLGSNNGLLRYFLRATISVFKVFSENVPCRMFDLVLNMPLVKLDKNFLQYQLFYEKTSLLSLTMYTTFNFNFILKLLPCTDKLLIRDSLLILWFFDFKSIHPQLIKTTAEGGWTKHLMKT